MTIIYARTFRKLFRKIPTQVQKAFYERLELFEANQHDPLLNNHKLHGKFAKYRSMNLTGDWRAVFRQTEHTETVEFVLIGTHSSLYG